MSQYAQNERGRNQGPRRPRQNNNRRNNHYSSHRPASEGRPRYERGHRGGKYASKPLTFWQKILRFLGFGPKETPQPVKRDEGKDRVVRGKTIRTGQVRTPRPPVNSNRLYVGNLSYETGESDLEDLFKGFGDVKTVEVIYNPRTHKSKGYAFIEMQTIEDALKAVEVMNDQFFMGRKLTVSGASERKPREEREEKFEKTNENSNLDKPSEISEETKVD